MNRETKTSGTFRPRGRGPRRGPRRPPRPLSTENATEENPANIAAPGSEPPAENISATSIEPGDAATPLAEAPVGEGPQPPSSSEGVPAVGQSPPLRPEHGHQQPRRHLQDRPQHFRRPFQPPSPPPQKFRSLQQASEEVLAIIERLNDVLCDMEQVSKMLDEVEIQQRSDEKEIESLRNALRQFQNQPNPRHQSPRDRDRDRDRGQGGGQPQRHDRYRGPERNPQHRQQPDSESRPTQPAPESQSAAPQTEPAQEDPEPHTPSET